MASHTEPVQINLPKLPVNHEDFIEYLDHNKAKPIAELLQPFQQYDFEMRKVFAQLPGHEAIATPSVVPVFAGREKLLCARARNLQEEDEKQRDSYIMPLQQEARRPDGSPAIVQSLKDFQTNFNVFSESSLVDLNWDNVVAAGSSVVTPLLVVPQQHRGSKRALRQYYHEQIAVASDVDLFLYDLTEEQAIEKIREIEKSIRDAILTETTTVRTKNAITIVSQYPTRHVQIVLRVYKSISEILTGFDVDCSCAAFDGKQVYASPRAIAAYITQINTIDLSRRSPSYENRLSKYARRGFEVYWPNLDRSRIDPTIFERFFGRTEGLARLLILEKLPRAEDREAYLDQRRAERGRPEINRYYQRRFRTRDNIKVNYEDEVAEWVDTDEVSDYHTFTIPYGPRYHARKIEKLLFTKDLLLNAEWNRPKDRKDINLHRHPAFFGRAEDVFMDCCGYCPTPGTDEEEELAEEESKIYVSGDVKGKFLLDNPGRQAIGSFNPVSAEGWTDMAYVGNTEQLCRAIVDHDAEFVRSWLQQEGNDPNTRDYTGRTPLHLAVSSSTVEIIDLLISHGSRIVARLVDGRTALHLAAIRGSVEIVSALLRKSEANEEEEAAKREAKRKARAAARNEGLDAAMEEATIDSKTTEPESDSDVDMVDDAEGEDHMDATTENSIVNIKSPVSAEQQDVLTSTKEREDEPDVYDVNVVAWDYAVSPLHLAIIKGNDDVVRCLVTEFGADVLLPVKLFHDYDKSARAAILTLVLALQLPLQEAESMTKTLIELGATIAQADMQQNTAVQYCIAEQPQMLQTLLDADRTGAARAIDHLSVSNARWSPNMASPLMKAIIAKDSLVALSLLTNGARSGVDFSAYMKAYQWKREADANSKHNTEEFRKRIQQPIVSAVQCELPSLAKVLIEQHGVDVNTLTTAGWKVVHEEYSRHYTKGESLLDCVRSKLKELRGWKPTEEDRPEEPLQLKDDEIYLSGLTEGSYQWWSASKQIRAAKENYERELKDYTKTVEVRRMKVKDTTAKTNAIQDLITLYEELQAALTKRDAKTFQQLYPDIRDPEGPHNRYRYHRYTPEKPQPFKLEYQFKLPDLTDEARARYLKLFEAAWSGNLKAVKQLTLTSWTNEEGKDQPPLKMATQDQFDLSPFHIAVLQGNLELASAMMEIAAAQYQPADDTENRRYNMDGGNSECGSQDDSQGSDAALYSEVVDEDFTVENVGEVSMQVKSRVTPLTMLLREAPVYDFLAEKLKIIGPPLNLIQFALHKDDKDLLTALLSLGHQYTERDVDADDENAKRFFAIPKDDFLEAIKLDRPHLVAEIIKRTGAGIPLDALVTRLGVEIIDKPKKYQGLSVYGKKRKDWADRGHEQVYRPFEAHRPPLLEACRANSLDTVEWFLSDAPMRAYREFANNNKDDKRIQVLAQAQGGFEATVTKFLNTRRNLAIHCCLMSKRLPETEAMLRFLIKTLPESVNFKSQTGFTPLMICFRLQREKEAQKLIQASADQTTRTIAGDNLIHGLLHRGVSGDRGLSRVESMLKLVDTRLLPTLFVERSTRLLGSSTPIAQWVDQVVYKRGNGKYADQVLRILLAWGGGRELGFVNGEGNTPIHVVVRQSNETLTRMLLEHDPTLALRENATGRTPYEMAEDDAIAALCGETPPLPGDHNFAARRVRKLGWPRDWNDGITGRDAQGFVPDTDEDRRSSDEKVWDLLKATKAELEAQGLGKRRLVTLNEANEVARRLAANKGSDRSVPMLTDNNREEVEDEVQKVDEVRLWLSQAEALRDDEDEDE
ncbi:hypothetical protein CERZMDRAFT_38359 [Cercospora zeae-maydis SCOH1-5]|uniref:Ankyrin repeat protein n=1 Tax=Cercospora zeae-maydis SCOH1-5 TaxID=717836 RepID=A0A6A6FL07_9PEZI|nr:hypothetical protein CERZMDRAFT_38359 [Cercospora zeae-maydis SCOH1-5]